MNDMTAPPELRVCPICNRSNRALAPHACSLAPWNLKACAGCGFVYLENPPHYDALSEDFAWEQTFELERKRRKAAEPVVFHVSRITSYFRRSVFKRDKLRRLIRQKFAPGNFLDVGCGHGPVFEGWNGRFVPYGIEASKHLAGTADASARAQGGHVIHANAMAGLERFPDAFFQGAILHSFLEHEVNPRGLVRALHRVMAAGGQVVIKVPNYACLNRRFRNRRWCGFRFPDHVNYFTPSSLRQLVEGSGFVVQRFTFRDRFPFSDNMWMVARKD